MFFLNRIATCISFFVIMSFSSGEIVIYEGWDVYDFDPFS